MPSVIKSCASVAKNKKFRNIKNLQRFPKVRIVSAERRGSQAKRLQPAPKAKGPKRPLCWFAEKRLALCRHPIGLALQLVEGADIGFGRGDHNIGVGSDPIDDAPAVLQPNGHLALTFRRAADRID